MSDHACATLTLEDHEVPQGRGYWKFDSSLLQHLELKEEVIKTIDDIASLNDIEDKCLRGRCVSFTSMKNEEKRKLVTTTTNTIFNLETGLCNKIENNKSIDEIRKIETEITTSRKKNRGCN